MIFKNPVTREIIELSEMDEIEIREIQATQGGTFFGAYKKWIYQNWLKKHGENQIKTKEV